MQNKIKVLLTEETTRELETAINQLPAFHCGREFLSECITAFRNAQAHTPEGNTLPLSSATKPVTVTPLIREYLLSQEAKEFFSKNSVLTEFHSQIIDYRL